MILHVRDVDDLGEPLADQAHHVRPRVVLAEEIGLDEGKRIVAAVVGVAIGAFGGDGVHSLRQVRRVVAFVHLVLKALVDVDVRRRDAQRRELPDDFRHDLVVRDAVGVTAAVHLQADDVGGREEPPPRLVWRRIAGQRAHPARQHLAHDLGVRRARRRIHARVRLDLRDDTRIGPGHAEAGRGWYFVTTCNRGKPADGFTDAGERHAGQQTNERTSIHREFLFLRGRHYTSLPPLNAKRRLARSRRSEASSGRSPDRCQSPT